MLTSHGRLQAIGLSLFGSALLLGVLELNRGGPSLLEISVVCTLAAAVAATFIALRQTAAELQGSLATRDELGERLGQQQAIARLGQFALTETPDQELLDEACRVVAARLGVEFAAVLEVLPDRTEFIMRSGIGWSPEELRTQRIPAGLDSQAGYTLASQRAVIMDDASRESRFSTSAVMATAGINSGLTASIGSNGGTYGILGAHTQARRAFSEHDVTFLEAVANVIASALCRRAAELEEEKTHRVLEAVIEGTNDDIFVKDLEGRVIALNTRAAQTLGAPQEELIGRTLHDVLPKPLADAMNETDRRIIERGKVETFEETVPIEGGTGVYLTTKGPYRARDGTLLGTFGIAHDITSRKKQEQALARSEERFRLAQEGANIGTWEVDLVNGVTTWSDGLRSLCGVGRDHPAGLEHFAELLHPDDRERVRRQIHATYASGARVELECRIVRPDGEVRWLLARSSSVRDDSGALVRILGVAVDVTQSKRIEEELSRRDEVLRLAQAAGRLGAWDWNLESGELLWTEGGYEIFGLDPAVFTPSFEAAGQYIHPDDWNVLRDVVQGVLDSDASYYECPCRVIRPTGETRWVINRATVIRNHDGVPIRMIGITLDETERRQAEDERAQLESRLRHAEKLEAVGQLAGGVAHDFNNMLAAIHGYGEIALAQLRSGRVDVADHIEAVLLAADRAAGITKQLLAFARRQVLNPELLDLNEVVASTSGFLERLLGDNVELVTILAERAVVVKADRGQLEQVVVNLAVNARDAMPNGGVLTIQVEEPLSDVAILSVADQGCGIDDLTAAHIFEPFFTTKGDNGNGLGLATVHGIVAQSGGQVMLESQVGHGSTFKIVLPLCATEVAPEATQPVAEPHRGTEKILLVEDDPAVREIIAMMLESRGYAVVRAADGEEAVKLFALEDRPIPLVLSDLMMRGLDGRQTINRIRAIAPSTKALFMSGYTEDAVIRAGGLADAGSFIGKPFSGDDLAARVRELLDGVSA